MIKNPCVICGRNVPLDETQLTICTKNRGIEAACLCHEGERSLADYITEHGGRGNIADWLKEPETEG